MTAVNAEVRRVMVLARGAPALKLSRALREAGLESVVLLAPHDGVAAWSQAADYSVALQGGHRSWPDPARCVEAAIDAGCDALLPAWDGLARDPDLAAACERAGLRWLGVPRDLLAFVRDRARVREQSEQLGLPVVPGVGPLVDVDLCEAWAASVGYPLALKSSLGRRPLIVVEDAEELRVAFQGLAEHGPVLAERYVLQAREIEVPIVGDGEETVVAVGTRDVLARVSHSRRVFIAPAGGLPAGVETQVMGMAIALAASLGWRGVGAVQFLLTSDGRPYLLDVRPGLSAGDSVTERIYGVDLADAAIRLGQGQRLGWGDEEVEADGTAVSVRLLASGSGPSLPRLGPGPFSSEVRMAAGSGESVRAGDELGEVLVQSAGRQAALVKARMALGELQLGTVPACLPGLRRLLSDQRLWRGDLWREDAASLVGEDPEGESR